MVEAVEPEAVRSLLAYLAAAETATPARATIAAGLRLDPDAMDDVLAEAEAGGWVESWEDAPGGPTVVLSSRSADRLGLELAVDESRATAEAGLYAARWVERGTQPPERSRRRGDRHADDDAAMLDDLPEAERSPALDAYADAWTAGARRRKAGTLRADRAPSREDLIYNLGPPPRPVVLVGLDVQWPPPPPDRNGLCSVCRGRLWRGSYCLACTRAWWDRLPTAISAAERPAVATASTPPLAGRLDGGLGRKIKRRSKTGVGR